MIGFWRRLSLQWKSALTLGLGLAALFGLFGTIAAQTLNQSTDAALEGRLAWARMAAEGVDDLIRHSRHQLESMASLPVLGGGDREEQIAALHDALHVVGSFNVLRLLNAQGVVQWEESASFGAIPLDPRDLSGQESVARVLATRETVVAQVSHPSPLHPPIAVVSVPVLDSEGALRNVIQGDLHLAHMEGELVPLPQLGPNSRVSLVDSQGNILASTIGDDLLSEEEHLEMLGLFISRGVPAVMLHRSADGVEHVVAFAPLDSLAGGGVIVEEMEDVVLAIPQRLRGMLLVFGSSALLLASLGAWLYIRRVVQPLRALTEAATFIAQGQLESPIVIERGDEIGELGRSFETMRRQLLARRQERLRWQQEMEEEVRVRTGQVHQLVGKIISAQEEERRRVARELHDGVAQSVATLILQVAAMEQGLPATSEAEPSRQSAQRAKAHATRTLEDLRRLVQDLRPLALDDMGLATAVRWYATTHLEPAGMHVEVHVSGEAPSLEGTVETAVFRILQEAINNVARHSQARRVVVRLDFSPKSLHATVEDDGRGFDVERVRGGSGGLGIIGMEERASLIGGHLTLRSATGVGTRVELEVPING